MGGGRKDPRDSAHSSRGLDSVTDKAASWGGQRNGEMIPSGEKGSGRLWVRWRKVQRGDGNWPQLKEKWGTLR